MLMTGSDRAVFKVDVAGFRADICLRMTRLGWTVRQEPKLSVSNGDGYEITFSTVGFGSAPDGTVRREEMVVSIHVSDEFGTYEHSVHGRIVGVATPENAIYVCKDLRWAAGVRFRVAT